MGKRHQELVIEALLVALLWSLHGTLRQQKYFEKKTDGSSEQIKIWKKKENIEGD